MKSSKKGVLSKLLTFGAFVITASLAFGTSLVIGALTFTSFTISGDSAVTVDNAGTLTLGNASATAIAIGRSGIVTTVAGTLNFTSASGTGASITNVTTTTNLNLGYITGSTQCLHVDTNGKITGTGSDCGTGTGTLSGNGTSTYIPIYSTATSFISTPSLIFTTSTGVFAVSGTSTFTGGSLMIGTSTGVSSALLTIATSSNILAVLSNGRVGIGTTNPGRILEISGSSSAGPAPGLKITDTDGRQYSLLQNYGGSFAGYFMIVDEIAGAARMTLDPSGKFGIGTTAPSSTLHISSTSSTIEVGASSTIGYGCIDLHAASGTVGTKVYVYTDSSGVLYSTTTKPVFCQ